jgi:hypothetical protein
VLLANRACPESAPAETDRGSKARGQSIARLRQPVLLRLWHPGSAAAERTAARSSSRPKSRRTCPKRSYPLPQLLLVSFFASQGGARSRHETSIAEPPAIVRLGLRPCGNVPFMWGRLAACGGSPVNNRRAACQAAPQSNTFTRSQSGYLLDTTPGFPCTKRLLLEAQHPGRFAR